MPTILQKNASSGQETAVPIFYQDTSLLWERDGILCIPGALVTEEEILLSVFVYINGAIDETILNGDYERFSMIKYIRDSNVKSQRDVLRETKQGKSQKASYGSSLQASGQYFNKDKFVKQGNTIKSVCTDGLYIDAVTNYQILLSQRMMNRNINEYLQPFTVFYRPEDGVQKPKRELFEQLYISNFLYDGYQLTSKFFGVTNTFLSNKFWILPEEFQSKGITYEIYTETEPPRIYTSLTDIINNSKEFSINSNSIAIDISGRDNIIFMSYERLDSLYEEQTGNFNNFLQYNIHIERGIDNEGDPLPGDVDINDLSYTDVIIISSDASGVDDDGIEKSTTKFSIINNMAAGLVGYYHQLDPTKTIENGTGFFDDETPQREEEIGQFIADLNVVKWYTGIINDAKYDPSIKNTGFNYQINDSRAVDEFVGTDGYFKFIGDEPSSESLYTNKDTVSNFIVNGFTFNNIQFHGSTGQGIYFIACNFENCTIINSNFNGCVFEECNFKNVISYNNTWNSYYDNLKTNDNPRSDLGFGYRFVNGSFIGPDIPQTGNTSKMTLSTTALDYDSGGFGYDYNVSGHNIQNGIKSVIDFCNNDGVTYNFRSNMNIEKNVRVNLDVEASTFHGEPASTFFDDTAGDKSQFVLRQTTNSSNQFMVQLFEDPVYEDTNQWYDRLNLITENNIVLEDDFFTFFMNYIARNPLFSGIDNRVEDENFYKHQFQKSTTSEEAVKIIGVSNKVPFDHPHHGTWCLARYPYNIINNRDVILTYGEQHIRDKFYELSNNDLLPNDLDNHPLYNDPNGIDYYGNPDHQTGWTLKNTGPLPYYRLDEEFTHKYLAHPTKGTDYGRFRMRKVNQNFQYIDTTSYDVRQYGPIRYNNGVITNQNTDTWDLSTNPIYNTRDVSFNNFRDFTFNFDSASVNTGY